MPNPIRVIFNFKDIVFPPDMIFSMPSVAYAGEDGIRAAVIIISGPPRRSPETVPPGLATDGPATYAAGLEKTPRRSIE
jgi:hypothetical protein